VETRVGEFVCPKDDEELAVEVERYRKEESLLKEIALHLKEYDTAPLNCTVSFMAQRLGRGTEEVYKGVLELLSSGIIGPWERWQKGAITPYRLLSISKLIDRGVGLSYDEVKSLTEPTGETHPGVPITAVESGVGGAGRKYLISLPAKEILTEISLRASRMGLVDHAVPKREEDAEKRSESLAQDFELSYLYIFFRSLFGIRDVEPLYAIYSTEGEDLCAFRKRTLTAILRSLVGITESLADKMGQDKPRREYVYFYASMLDRYLRLAQELGIPEGNISRLTELRAGILGEVGGGD
jgi:hypothetical protein